MRFATRTPGHARRRDLVAAFFVLDLALLTATVASARARDALPTAKSERIVRTDQSARPTRRSASER